MGCVWEATLTTPSPGPEDRSLSFDDLVQELENDDERDRNGERVMKEDVEVDVDDV